MVAEAIMNSVANYLQKLGETGIPALFGVVFGSQVKGKADSWSDIDVVVVSPLFDIEITREKINLLWRVAARTDSRIEPIPCGEKQWREDTASAILEIARLEGTLVNP
jgi:hypothetical protein